MKPHHYCWIGILAVGALATYSLLEHRKIEYNNSDPITSNSSPVSQQNNFWPTASRTTPVGTNMATPSRSYSYNADNSWEQGGSSSVTNTTGRWAA